MALYPVGTHSLLHILSLQNKGINEKKFSPKDLLGPDRQDLVRTNLLEGKGSTQRGTVHVTAAEILMSSLPLES